MTPGARLKTAWDFIEESQKSSLLIDDQLRSFFKESRFVGSKDRIIIREFVFNFFRHYQEYVFRGAMVSSRAPFLLSLSLSLEALGLCMDGAPYHLSSLTEEERALLSMPVGESPLWARLNIPLWIWEKGQLSEEEALAYNQEAPLDLRVNTRKKTRASLLKALQKEGEAISTPHAPHGIRVLKKTSLETSLFYKEGAFEVQDEGSQLVGALVKPLPGMKVLDLCAGAGGKTLQLADEMGDLGFLFASDVDESRLKRAKARLDRQGSPVTFLPIEKVYSHHQGFFDRVLVDAPCTGTGTWRRHPELKLRLTPEFVKEMSAVQSEILSKAFSLLKPNGQLVYVTCSFLREENEEVIEAFLQKQSRAKIIPTSGSSYMRLSPLTHGTDGFFACVLERMS